MTSDDFAENELSCRTNDLNAMVIKNQKQVFTLSTGRKSVFELKYIEAFKVESLTYVVQETNGRDQSSLTAASLKDITRTIKLQQFYPCIGIQRGDKIEIIDGSRRRAAAINCQSPLTIMVTNDDISLVEARFLAKDIQSSREHNLREIGIRLQTLKKAGLNQKEISAQEGMSEAKVTRAMQAANVPQALVNLFPEQSELTFNDYKKLLNIDKMLKEREEDISVVINGVKKELESESFTDNTDPDVIKRKILAVLITSCSNKIIKESTHSTVTTQLWKFENKDSFARKKVKGRSFSYEFGRLPKNIQGELDVMIKRVLSTYLKKEEDKT